jgi:pimeloyl-ACP methyl ester carboxylesterase
LPVVGQSARAVSIDLLGYGYSDKPDPRDFPTNSLYCFETWGAQLLDFIDWRFGGEPAFIITNSVGGACNVGWPHPMPHCLVCLGFMLLGSNPTGKSLLK